MTSFSDPIALFCDAIYSLKSHANQWARQLSDNDNSFLHASISTEMNALQSVFHKLSEGHQKTFHSSMDNLVQVLSKPQESGPDKLQACITTIYSLTREQFFPKPTILKKEGDQKAEKAASWLTLAKSGDHLKALELIMGLPNNELHLFRFAYWYIQEHQLVDLKIIAQVKNDPVIQCVNAGLYKAVKKKMAEGKNREAFYLASLFDKETKQKAELYGELLDISQKSKDYFLVLDLLFSRMFQFSTDSVEDIPLEILCAYFEKQIGKKDLAGAHLAIEIIQTKKGGQKQVFNMLERLIDEDHEYALPLSNSQEQPLRNTLKGKLYTNYYKKFHRQIQNLEDPKLLHKPDHEISFLARIFLFYVSSTQCREAALFFQRLNESQKNRIWQSCQHDVKLRLLPFFTDVDLKNRYSKDLSECYHDLSIPLEILDCSEKVSKRLELALVLKPENSSKEPLIDFQRQIILIKAQITSLKRERKLLLNQIIAFRYFNDPINVQIEQRIEVIDQKLAKFKSLFEQLLKEIS